MSLRKLVHTVRWAPTWYRLSLPPPRPQQAADIILDNPAPSDPRTIVDHVVALARPAHWADRHSLSPELLLLAAISSASAGAHRPSRIHWSPREAVQCAADRPL